MSIQELASTTNTQVLSTIRKNQYTLWQILGIWFMAAAPMGILGWLAYPALSAGLAPLDAGMMRMKLMLVGLVWQFILSMIILYREEGNIRIGTISRRFWLNHPKSLRSGKTNKALWWWLIPLIVFVAALEIGLRSTLVDVWTEIFPFFAEPAGYDMAAMFTPELRSQLVGAWGVLALLAVNALFNTFLGEEFLFRGVLLPKMEGVFGKWDWVANGALFSFYHFHQPWGILATLLGDVVIAFSGKYFRTTWFPIIIHSGQAVYFLVLVLGLVLGLA